MVVEAVVGPMMPEDPIRLRADEIGAVFPRDVDRFRVRAGQSVRSAGSVVAERRPLTESERFGERRGVRRQLGAGYPESRRPAPRIQKLVVEAL